MWVSRKGSWHKDTTDLEKFLAERLIQRCDYEESITKKHRTISGYTQLKELIKIGELSFHRNRTIKTLIVQMSEAKSTLIRQNISNDIVVTTYFDDFKKYIDNYDLDGLKNQNNNLGAVTKLLHRLKNFEKQLDRHYLSSLEKELLKVNFKEEKKFHREAKKISALVDLIVPYFLFNGYSISSVNEVLRKWLERSYRVTAKRLINFFNFVNKEFEFLINISEEDDSSKDFIKLITKKIPNVNEVDFKEVNKSIEPRDKIKQSARLISYNFYCFDPNAHIRNKYDNLLKDLVIGKDRKSLAPFTDYFNNCYWANNKHHKKHYKKAKIHGDPISIPARRSTLRTSLQNDPKVEKFTQKSEIPIPNNLQLKKAIYYYNLAIGSKSLENSLSLLWTSIETIIPYRTLPTDIECVRELISKALSLGAIGRDVSSFADRFIVVNHQNEHILDSLNTKKFDSFYSYSGIGQWYNWLSDSTDTNDKFDKIKECSELLAYEYYTLGKPLSEGKIKFLLERIASSKASIEFQLQRIYLHRNQIVHSGDMINEYSNLWIHLEWYVGKILYYCLKNIHILNIENDLEGTFRQLEADYDYLVSYLDKNSAKKIGEVSRIKTLILQHFWQAF
jgi:ribosomal protein L30E